MNPSTYFLCLASCLFIFGSVFSQGNPSDWVYYNTANSGIPDNNVTSISVGQDNHKWIATRAGGVARFDGNNWVVYNTNNSGIPSNNIHQVVIQGTDVWMFTHVFSPQGDVTSLLIRFDGDQWSIWDNFGYIQSISAGQDGFVWVGSKIGLLKFDGTSRTDFNDQNSCLTIIFGILPLIMMTKCGWVRKRKGWRYSKMRWSQPEILSNRKLYLIVGLPLSRII